MGTGVEPAPGELGSGGRRGDSSGPELMCLRIQEQEALRSKGQKAAALSGRIVPGTLILRAGPRSPLGRLEAGPFKDSARLRLMNVSANHRR